MALFGINNERIFIFPSNHRTNNVFSLYFKRPAIMRYTEPLQNTKANIYSRNGSMQLDPSMASRGLKLDSAEFPLPLSSH